MSVFGKIVTGIFGKAFGIDDEKADADGATDRLFERFTVAQPYPRAGITDDIAKAAGAGGALGGPQGPPTAEGRMGRSWPVLNKDQRSSHHKTINVPNQHQNLGNSN